MLETLFSESLGRAVAWDELASTFTDARKTPEAYHAWIATTMPLRGEALTPEQIVALTEPSLTKRMSIYKNTPATSSCDIDLRSSRNWHTRPWESPLLTGLMAEARVAVARLGGCLNYQYLNVMQRSLHAADTLTVGGIPHYHRGPDRCAGEGMVNVFCNAVRPGEVAAAGFDINAWGMRLANMDGFPLPDFRAWIERFDAIEEEKDMAKLWVLKDAVPGGWHVLQPNHWYVLCDGVPHYAATLDAGQRALARRRMGRKLAGTRMTTFNIQNFFQPLPEPPLSPEMAAKRAALSDDIMRQLLRGAASIR